MSHSRDQRGEFLVERCTFTVAFVDPSGTISKICAFSRNGFKTAGLAHSRSCPQQNWARRAAPVRRFERFVPWNQFFFRPWGNDRLIRRSPRRTKTSGECPSRRVNNTRSHLLRSNGERE